MASWHKFFPVTAGFKRIKGGPQPEIALGDVLSETITGLGTPIELQYTVACLIPDRLIALEGRVVYKGITNPKARMIGVWMFFPEPDGGTKVARYFNGMFDVKPEAVNAASDSELMQRMLEGFKRIAESQTPEK
jgi:hypothetical protein